MSQPKAKTAFDGIAKQLASRAITLASAHLRSKALSDRNKDRRWRDPALLWPLFTKG